MAHYHSRVDYFKAMAFISATIIVASTLAGYTIAGPIDNNYNSANDGAVVWFLVGVVLVLTALLARMK